MPRTSDRRHFLAALIGAPVVSTLAAAGPSRVLTGLDRVVAAQGAPLLGRRVGLMVHAASVAADGRHAIDALSQSGVRLVRLFGAEHGYRGLAAAGENVNDGVDAATGLPVVSLYGKKSKPSAEDLAGLDVFVVDMQDAGVRFYTYAASMMLCLEACADAGVPMVILDRPNPLGGVRMDGPVRGPSGEVKVSLLNMAPGPLVHGLTMAEIARVVNGARERKATLDAVRLQGWKRAMTWAGTGLPWVNPSPNLRSADACLAYPGTCLIEGTNASEGRGTEAPFLRIGAPWLKAAEMASAVKVPGFSCAPVKFTPRASSAAPSPKLLDVACEGLAISVTDAATAEPWRLGLTIVVEMKKRHPDFSWNGDGSGFDRLVGTRALRGAIDRGASVDEILREESPDIEAFRKARAPHLLY